MNGHLWVQLVNSSRRKRRRAFKRLLSQQEKHHPSHIRSNSKRLNYCAEEEEKVLLLSGKGAIHTHYSSTSPDRTTTTELGDYYVQLAQQPGRNGGTLNGDVSEQSYISFILGESTRRRDWVPLEGIINCRFDTSA